MKTKRWRFVVYLSGLCRRARRSRLLRAPSRTSYPCGRSSGWRRWETLQEEQILIRAELLSASAVRFIFCFFISYIVYFNKQTGYFSTKHVCKYSSSLQSSLRSDQLSRTLKPLSNQRPEDAAWSALISSTSAAQRALV